MASERVAYRASTLEVVPDGRKDGRELLIIDLGTEEAKHVECGYLRLKQCRYLARENDDILVGYPAEEREIELE
jgi:hypothetical protein